ncbi:SGNH/GDSL hydrolase family protein [Streptomyces sp. T-3]|nr:SGNH/GDSL hydrolase family protein [Streptomyces sp. T-3]
MTAPNSLLHGVSWWHGDQVVRADPADRDRLPGDTWERATVPAGVRLEFVAHGARAVQIEYAASEALPADAYRGQEPVFTLLRGDEVLAEAAAEPTPKGVVRLELPATEGTDRAPSPPTASASAAGDAFTIHLPEILRPALYDVRALGGTLSPAPARPRWLVYGDSISEGWTASRPHLAWPAVAGRALGLDTVNLGYAGAARGELASAEQLANLPGDLITLAFGTNCWSRTPCSAPLLYETTRAFLTVIRQAHPDTPLLVLSPVVRPDAEHTPNPLGATLSDLREAMERATEDARATDKHLTLLPGGPLLGPEHLADGVHPDDAGHARMGTAVTDSVRASFGRSASPY